MESGQSARTQAGGLVLETSGLGKCYGEVTALDGLNLRVARHTIIAILGPNGAGKSTTIRLLLGLVRPSGGGGTIFGYDIERESLAIRRRVGYLAQEPRFDAALTARETLLAHEHPRPSGARLALGGADGLLPRGRVHRRLLVGHSGRSLSTGFVRGRPRSRGWGTAMSPAPTGRCLSTRT